MPRHEQSVLPHMHAGSIGCLSAVCNGSVSDANDLHLRPGRTTAHLRHRRHDRRLDAAALRRDRREQRRRLAHQRAALPVAAGRVEKRLRKAQGASGVVWGRGERWVGRPGARGRSSARERAWRHSARGQLHRMRSERRADGAEALGSQTLAAVWRVQHSGPHLELCSHHPKPAWQAHSVREGRVGSGTPHTSTHADTHPQASDASESARARCCLGCQGLEAMQACWRPRARNPARPRTAWGSQTRTRRPAFAMDGGNGLSVRGGAGLAGALGGSTSQRARSSH